MTVRWGRAYRGRVWHLLGQAGRPLCDREDPITEANPGLPPRGGGFCLPEMRRCGP